MIPTRTMRLRGLPMHRAPRYILPYLDCVDGAMPVAGVIRDGVACNTWALQRGGVEVGRVTVEVE